MRADHQVGVVAPHGKHYTGVGSAAGAVRKRHILPFNVLFTLNVSKSPFAVQYFSSSMFSSHILPFNVYFALNVFKSPFAVQYVVHPHCFFSQNLWQ